jgi:hypothetical protein
MGSSRSQSPRANRSSTQNPLEHAKAEVQYEVGSTGRVLGQGRAVTPT